MKLANAHWLVAAAFRHLRQPYAGRVEAGIASPMHTCNHRDAHMETILYSDPTEIPPLSRDRCSNTPVDRRLYYRRLSLLHPTSFHKDGLSQAKDRPRRGGGIAEKTYL